MNDASPASDIPRARTGPVKPGPWRIADIVDGRKLRIQLTAAALDNGSDPIAQRKRALDLIHAALQRGIDVASANKQAVSRDPAGLLALARTHGARLQWSASVGGGMLFSRLTPNSPGGAPVHRGQ